MNLHSVFYSMHYFLRVRPNPLPTLDKQYSSTFFLTFAAEHKYQCVELC